MNAYELAENLAYQQEFNKELSNSTRIRTAKVLLQQANKIKELEQEMHYIQIKLLGVYPR